MADRLWSNGKIVRRGAVPVQETVAGVAQILGVQRKAALGAFDAFREAGAIETTRGVVDDQ